MQKSSRQSLDRIREIVAGEPSWEKLSDQGVLLQGYEKFVFQTFHDLYLRRSEENGPDSIQSELMRILRFNYGNRIDLDYEEARKRARRQLLESVIRIHFAEADESRHSLETVITARQIIQDPGLVRDTDEWAADFVSQLTNNGPGFLKAMLSQSDRLDNSARDNEWELLALARHWTDCDCPLWLMNRKTILKAGSTFFAFHPHDSPTVRWSFEHLKYLLKTNDLKRFTPSPITDVNLDPEPQRGIQGFGIAKEIFPSLEKTEFRFVEPRWYHPSHADAMRMRESKALLDNAKELDVDSPRYKKMLAAYSQLAARCYNPQHTYEAYECSKRPLKGGSKKPIG